MKNYFENFDIVNLCETWAKSENEFDSFLESYTHYNNVREKPKKSLRNSGGVSVFIKKELVKK